MKKLLFVFITAFIGSASFSQSTAKLDYYLALKQQDYIAKKASANLMLPMLIQGNITGIKQLVKANGGAFKYSYGDIAAIIIPVSAMAAFNESPSVKRMEGNAPHIIALDDTSNVKNHITEVLNGDAPLTHAYNGKGVVIGFIDTGIDYKHSDFRDSSGTRVQFYWDQNRFNDAYTPSAYGYGQAWNKAQLDAATGNLALSMDSASIIDYGHGTNVAGVAVGNADCNTHEIGGCPKSDIIYVAYNLNTNDVTALSDAVQYVYTCADSLNEPCVLNISLGSYQGSHDDSDLQGELIDNIIAAKQPGRVLVAAGGNFGAPYHVHDSLTKGDTTFTWFLYDGGYGFADIPIFANQPNFKNVKFRLRCDKVQTGSYFERDNNQKYSDISKYMGLKTDTVKNSVGQVLGIAQSFGQVWANGSYSLEFRIVPDSSTTSYYWGFEATDTATGTTPGRFDIWDIGAINGVKDTAGLSIKPALFPGIRKYQQPDTFMTICSSFQCSPHVITAQTYYNRKTWKDCNGSPETLPGRPGTFNFGTSRGPVRNYIHMKPDVAAAGDNTLSAYPLYYLTTYGCATEADSLGCHNIDGGTSLACPMVSSAAALYLEKYPHASDSNVRRCIIETAYSDAFTGGYLPNYDWGYGKLDAFNALTMCGPTGIPLVSAPGNSFCLSAYPNPFTMNTTITFDFSGINSFNQSSIIVYDMMGKAVKTVNLKSNKGSITLDRTNLAAGIYFYSLIVDGSRLKTEKLEIL